MERDTQNDDGRERGVTRRAALRALAGSACLGAGIAGGAGSAAADSRTGAAAQASLRRTAAVVAGDGDPGDGFGYETAVGEGGDTLAFSAVADDGPNGPQSGAVYVFRRPDAVALDGTDDLLGDVTLDRSVDPREVDLVYRGQLVVLDGLTNGEIVTVRDADSGLALTERTVSGTTAQIDTSASVFEQFVGRSFELESPSIGTVPFTFVAQDYEVDTDRVTVDNGGAGATAEVTVESVNRGGHTHVVSSPDLTGPELAALVRPTEYFDAALRDADGDGDEELVLAGGSVQDVFEVDATGLSPGEYTLEFGVFDAVASDEVTVEVVGTGPYVQETRVVADDGTGNDFFGDRVALSDDGTTLVVGARAHGADGESSGAAYVFDRDGRAWDQTDKLTAADASGGALLGSGVAVADDGSTALVGAPGATDADGTTSGAVYAFERRGALWTQTATVTSADGDGGDGLGTAVALSADATVAVVGASTDDPNGENSGSAYVFERDEEGWTQATRLTPVGGDAQDFFGDAVALSADGSTALVGALDFEDSGTAYVYGRDGGEWSFEATLLASGEGGGGTPGDFGRSVALTADGATALIGAPGDGDGATGAAVRFERGGSGWRRTARVAPEDGEGAFGRGVALGRAGRVGVVGDNSADNPNGVDAGTGYVYEAVESLSDRFDDGNDEVDAREVLGMIDAYNAGEDAVGAQDVLAAIEAYNDDAGWDTVDG